MDDDEMTPWQVEPRSTENGLWALINSGSNSLYDVELTGATAADTARLDSASLDAAPSIFNPDAPYRFRVRKPVGVATTLVVTWADSPGGRPLKQRITIQ
ncbi:hypothetical protein ACLQ2Q_15760 [Microbacterium sp. DT81.1]|uniref:hypothetical protein n=1 Tax=Microbacterium sp. DT81.1 TaxID=3393413 RepID=UPI003CFAD75A